MTNERLRSAMVRGHVTIDDVCAATGVDHRTVQRWLNDRTPHQKHRWTVARLLNDDEAYLWPRSSEGLAPGAASTAEAIAAYSKRADVPRQPQHLQLLVGDHGTQPRHAGPDQRDRVGVGGIGLAALTRGEDPRPGRQLRRDVDDVLTIGQQAHRDVLADAGAALDR